MADVDPYRRAVELQDAAVRAEKFAQNVDSSWSADDVWRLVNATRTDFKDHLREHRDILGDHPEFGFEYYLIDNPPPPDLDDSLSPPSILGTGGVWDDPPF